MARAGENGFPKGTICELVFSINAEYRYQMCEVVSDGKVWNSEYNCWSYHVDLFKVGKVLIVADNQLKFNNYPTKWENWLDNKITMLLKCPPEIDYQLREELRREAKK